MAKKYIADTFEGALTGTASGNLAKTGDTMSGNLSINKTTSGGASMTIFTNNNDSFPDTELVFQQKNIMSSTPYEGKLTFKQSYFDLDQRLEITSNSGSSNLKITNGRLQLGTSSSANVINKYEVGTWTPELTTYQIFGSPYITNQSYSLREGTYTKIGRIVRLEFKMVLNATVTYSNRTVIINGLPFTLRTSGYGTSTGNINYYQKLNNMDQLAGLAFLGNSNNVFGLQLRDSSNTDRTRNFVTNDLASNISSMTPIRIYGSFIYETNQ